MGLDPHEEKCPIVGGLLVRMMKTLREHSSDNEIDLFEEDLITPARKGESSSSVVPDKSIQTQQVLAQLQA